MEEGAVEKLPPKTFLRGFVASYANYLQLDTEGILKIFFEEMGSTRPEIALQGDYQDGGDRMRSSDRSRSDRTNVAALTQTKKFSYFKIYGIVGIIILIVFIGLIKKKMDSYESESVPQTPTTIAALPGDTVVDPNPAASPAATPSAAVAVSATATPTATATPNQTPAGTPAPSATPSPSPTATPVEKASPTPEPTPKPTATPKPTPAPTSSPTSSLKTNDAAAAAGAASPSPTPTLNRGQDVIVEALNDVEIDIQIDNEASKKMTLHHDEIEHIKARRKVTLKFSDGGAVNLTINGKDRGVPGDLGKPKKLDLP
jgi:cytoskeleton protein RodZ